MLLSSLILKPLKNPPKDEVSANAKLLEQGGYIEKLIAGVYTYLPLGLIVLRKIENIIRAEIKKSGSLEILMPALQPRENWQKTGRWDNLDVLFKIFEREGREPELALGATHEEIITPLVAKNPLSYKDLPFSLFQIQTKFRDEKRSRSGILRGREFLMKDQYSFHKDAEDMESFYEKMKFHYLNIFNTVGIGEKTYLTYASGGSFSKYSHEFQMVSGCGEDNIFICSECHIAVNDEVVENNTPACPKCNSKNLQKENAIEVGNIFPLKTKFSEAFGLRYKTREGQEKLVEMGCYGIGIGRLMGTIVEHLNDSRGIMWPKSVAPFLAEIIPLGLEKSEVAEASEDLYKKLTRAGVETIYDNREGKSAGERFADADFIGAPYRIVLSEKTLKEDKYELKERGKDGTLMLTYSQLLEYVQKT